MMSVKLYPSIACVLLLVMACTQPVAEKPSNENLKDRPGLTAKKAERYGMVTGLKPERTAYYKKLHAAVWPRVLKKITESNIRNYSIYLKEINGKSYLFSYWEYIGDDFAADMKKMAADTTTQRWWKETSPAQIPLPDAAEKGETWSRMEEVFHED